MFWLYVLKNMLLFYILNSKWLKCLFTRFCVLPRLPFKLQRLVCKGQYQSMTIAIFGVVESDTKGLHLIHEGRSNGHNFASEILVRANNDVTMMNDITMPPQIPIPPPQSGGITLLLKCSQTTFCINIFTCYSI